MQRDASDPLPFPASRDGRGFLRGAGIGLAFAAGAFVLSLATWKVLALLTDANRAGDGRLRVLLALAALVPVLWWAALASVVARARRTTTSRRASRPVLLGAAATGALWIGLWAAAGAAAAVFLPSVPPRPTRPRPASPSVAARPVDSPAAWPAAAGGR